MHTNIELEVRRCWNAGLTKAEAVTYILTRFNIMKDKMRCFTEEQKCLFTAEQIEQRFDRIESVVGCRSLRIDELHGGTLTNKVPKVDTSEWSEEYKRWKGVSGKGALLKELVKAHNEEIESSS